MSQLIIILNHILKKKEHKQLSGASLILFIRAYEIRRNSQTADAQPALVGHTVC